MNPLRLLLVNYEFPPNGAGGGNATAEIANCLVAMGHSVVVLTGAEKKSLKIDKELSIIRLNSGRTRRDRSTMLEMFRFVVGAICWVLKQKRSLYDGVIVFFLLPCGPVGLFAKWWLGVPYVISLRGADVCGFEPSLNSMHKLLSRVSRLIASRAQAVVANSYELRRLAVASGLGKIGVIPNGVNTEEFRQRPPDFSKKTDPLRLVTVSRLHAQKRVTLLVKLFAKLIEEGFLASLEIVGDGPDRAEIEHIVKEKGLEGCVRLKGWVGRADLASILCDADCFVTLSQYEGMSNSMLEAMASSLPVVASRIPAHAELIQDGVNGVFVDPVELASFRDAIDFVGTSRERSARMGAASRRLILAKFRWQEIAQDYVALFA